MAARLFVVNCREREESCLLSAICPSCPYTVRVYHRLGGPFLSYESYGGGRFGSCVYDHLGGGRRAGLGV